MTDTRSETRDEIARAVAALCDRFGEDYWRQLDKAVGYPTEFVAEMTEAGFLTALIPAALFSALIAVQTVGGDEALVLDARILGVGAGAVAVWRKAPFVVVVVVAMAVTALVRWQTWV